MKASSRNAEPVNLVAGFPDFMRRWARQDEANHSRIDFVISEGGNINIDTTAACNISLILTRWHPSFLSCIEPGVRELVDMLVARWDCVTYSSCEGHRATADEPARVRHVRMVSRSAAEHASLGVKLEQLVLLTNAASAGDNVVVVWQEATVCSTHGLEAPGLDLVFAPRSEIGLLYWRDLESAYRLAVAHVRDGQPAGERDLGGGQDRRGHAR